MLTHTNECHFLIEKLKSQQLFYFVLTGLLAGEFFIFAQLLLHLLLVYVLCYTSYGAGDLKDSCHLVSRLDRNRFCMRPYHRKLQGLKESLWEEVTKQCRAFQQ